MYHEPTHLDLFSGIGGFALAARWAGFRTVGFCEIEPFARAVLAEQFGAGGGGDAPSLHRDIYDLDGREYVGVDLITGGFPCQPYSLAGKRRGAADDRAIWPQMLRVIAEARPGWVLAENVPGIVNMELDRVLSDLEAEGYTTGALVIPACAVAAKHRRDRVWIVGNSACPQCNGSTRQWLSGTRRSSVGPCGASEAQPAWIPCPDGCGEFWCTIHNQHAFECQCPPIEEWGDIDPYSGRQLLERRIGEPAQGTTERQPQPRLGGMADGVSRWLDEPADVPRVAKGIPNRVSRLKCLGNAIVPQVAYRLLTGIYAECVGGDFVAVAPQVASK